MIYKKFIRPVLFKFEPEFIHNLTLLAGRVAGFTRVSRLLRGLFVFKDERLEQEILGIKFENPVGLAAGFDKNAQLTGFLPDLGFGFAEIGSVTANPCKGNPKPRLHRLIKEKGIIVNYGLANKGVEEIGEKLKGKKFRIPIGISIAKTNNPSIKGKESIEDYFKSFKKMRDIGNYLTINISCPNAGDGRSFEDPKLLEDLLKKIQKIRKKEIIFIKVSPDLSKKNLDKIIELAGKYQLNGFVISNLSKDRKGLELGDKARFKGGISGKIVKEKSNKMIKYVYEKTKGRFVIIGCGGVFNGRDAYEKIKAGASLIQLITGMIYEGPGVISRINKELVRLMENRGYKNMGEVVGSN